MEEIVQDLFSSFEIKSITNFKINDNYQVYGNLKYFDSYIPKLGIGVKYHSSIKYKKDNFKTIMNYYLNSNLDLTADVKISFNNNAEFGTGFSKLNRNYYPFINLTFKI